MLLVEPAVLLMAAFRLLASSLGLTALALAATTLSATALGAVPREPAPRTVELDGAKAEPRLNWRLPPPATAAPTPLTPAAKPTQVTAAAPPKPEHADNPSPEAPTSRWTELESTVLHQLVLNKPVDLRAQSLSGAFVSALLQGTVRESIGAAGVRLSNGVIEGNVSADSALVPWLVAFENVELHGSFSATDSQFARELKLTGKSVSGQVLLDGAQIGGALELQDSTFLDRVSLSGIEVAGALFVDRSHFSHGFSLKNGTILGALQAFDTTFPCTGADCDGGDAVPSFWGAHIGGDLTLARTHFDGKVDASQLRVDRSLILDHAVFGGPANFGAGVVGNYFVVDAPQFKKNVSLVQLRYGSISNGEENLNDENTWRDLKKLFANCEFSSDIYSRLEEFFTGSGESDLANSVYIEEKIQERRRLSGAALIVNWTLYLTIAYGRHPALAFVWSLLFILIGTGVFYGEAGMLPTEADKPSSKYSAFWFSVDLFVPLTRLQAADRWVPKKERRYAWSYLRIHHLLGWVLIPLGVAALTGLIK